MLYELLCQYVLATYVAFPSIFSYLRALRLPRLRYARYVVMVAVLVFGCSDQCRDSVTRVGTVADPSGNICDRGAVGRMENGYFICSCPVRLPDASTVVR